MFAVMFKDWLRSTDSMRFAGHLHAPVTLLASMISKTRNDP
jgi:hypothetical protein